MQLYSDSGSIIILDPFTPVKSVPICSYFTGSLYTSGMLNFVPNLIEELHLMLDCSSDKTNTA